MNPMAVLNVVRMMPNIAPVTLYPPPNDTTHFVSQVYTFARKKPIAIDEMDLVGGFGEKESTWFLLFQVADERDPQKDYRLVEADGTAWSIQSIPSRKLFGKIHECICIAEN